MTPDQLRAIVPTMMPERAEAFAPAMTAAMVVSNISTLHTRACFVAQALHESCGFSRMTENLDYSADALLRIWPKRFTAETARMYGRVETATLGGMIRPGHAANQQMIANVAYANRMGNGSIESGDGWRYRGRGPGQLTGLDNYRKCGEELGFDLVQSPDQVALPKLGCAAFGWFWRAHNLNALAEALDIPRLRAAINGGDLGLAACESLTDKALEVLA